MTKTSTRLWDPAEHLESDDDMAAYLGAALEEGDPTLFAAALGDVARAKGMSQLARETGLGRESLYKALSLTGNPEFATVLRVLGALGLRLHATAVGAKVTPDSSCIDSTVRDDRVSDHLSLRDRSTNFAPLLSTYIHTAANSELTVSRWKPSRPGTRGSVPTRRPEPVARPCAAPRRHLPA